MGHSGTSPRLRYRWDGPERAPVVVLSNSMGTALEMWDEQAAALAGEFRVLRYDHRGHGLSAVPEAPYSIDDFGRDVLRLLDELGIDRVSYCGLSLGGMVGLWIASGAPERVERLILCCTSARFGTADLWAQRAADVRREGMAAVAHTLLERWFTPGFREASPEAVERVLAMLQATPPEGYARCCEALAEADMHDRLPDIAAPTLVLGGSDDPVSPPEHTRVLENGIPRARAAFVPAAHLANIERPAEVTATILEHLREGRR